MFNYRLKKVLVDLGREMTRSGDDQIKELYEMVKEEYNSRFQAEPKKKRGRPPKKSGAEGSNK